MAFISRTRSDKLRELALAFEDAAHRLSIPHQRREMTLASLCAQLHANYDAIRLLLMKGRSTQALGQIRTAYELCLWISFICSNLSEDRSRHYKALEAHWARKHVKRLLDPHSAFDEAFRLAALKESSSPQAMKLRRYKLRKEPREGPKRSYMIKHLLDQESRTDFDTYEAYIFGASSAVVHARSPGANNFLGRRGITSLARSEKGVEFPVAAAFVLGFTTLRMLGRHRKTKGLESRVSIPSEVTNGVRRGSNANE